MYASGMSLTLFVGLFGVLIWVGVVAYGLYLATRLVNAVEKIAAKQEE